MDKSSGRSADVIRLRPAFDGRLAPAGRLQEGLPFVKLVERQLLTCRRYGACFAVVAVRLEGLREVGEHHGREVQERLMELATQRLRCRLRSTDSVACTGGDAFGVALFQVHLGSLAAIEARLFDELSAPYRIGDLSVEVTAMTGAAVFPRAGLTAGELVACAEQALKDKIA